jgi:Protein of unknown function (DUF1571)
MKSTFIGAPQGRGYWTGLLQRRLLALVVAAAVLAGVAIAQNCRSPAERPSAVATLQVPAADGSATTSLLSVPVEHPPHPLRDPIALAEESRAALREVRDYTALFTKIERINGRLRKQVMEMKLREEPFSIYLLYQSKREDGRQAVYVEGKYDNNLVVRDVGLRAVLGTVQMGLRNPLVTCENRYPVTYLGITNVVDTSLTIWERESKVPEARPAVTIEENSRLGDRVCCEVMVKYQHRHPEIEYPKSHLYFDNETKLPIHVERYGWPAHEGEDPPLMEEYDYANVKLNVGLTDADFDPARYGF